MQGASKDSSHNRREIPLDSPGSPVSCHTRELEPVASPPHPPGAEQPSDRRANHGEADAPTARYTAHSASKATRTTRSSIRCRAVKVGSILAKVTVPAGDVIDAEVIEVRVSTSSPGRTLPCVARPAWPPGSRTPAVR